MKIFTILFVFVATFTVAQNIPSKGPFGIQGVKLWVGNIPGMYNEYLGQPLYSDNFYSWHDVLLQIKNAGANNVMLQLSTGVMVTPTDNEYSQTSYNPPLDVLRAMASEIRGLGMDVSITLFSNVENVITGSGTTLDRPYPSDPQLWFNDHHARVVDWAKFAEEIEASSMVIFADEVNHLVEDPQLTGKWTDLIDAVRSNFSGKISSIIWTPGNGTSVSRIPTQIITKLDYLGIGFFPNLIRQDNPSVQALVDAYHSDADGHDPLNFIKQLAVTYEKKIWITDKAFHSFKGASADEYRVFDSTIPLEPDESVQANLYESFLKVMAYERGTWLEGVSFQNYNNIKPGAFSIARFVNGPVSESPQNKMAETVLSQWFNGEIKSDQAITFEAISDKSLADPAFSISALSSSGLPVSFSESSSKISITNDQVILIEAGRATIVANQAGDAHYEPTSVSRSFCINPIKPIVTLDNQSTSVLLNSNSDTGNQWFRNDILIQGATNKTLNTTEPGIYKVQVSADDCKSPFSDSKSVVITGGVSPETRSQIKLYPNPVENHLLVTLPDNNKLKSIITLESTGKILKQSSTYDKEITLDISSYAQGQYLIKVHSGNDQLTYRFVKK